MSVGLKTSKLVAIAFWVASVPFGLTCSLLAGCAVGTESEEAVVEQEEPILVSGQAIAPSSVAESNFAAEGEEGPPKGDEGLQTASTVETSEDEELEPDPEPWVDNDNLGDPKPDDHGDDDNSHDGCGDGMHEPP